MLNRRAFVGVGLAATAAAAADIVAPTNLFGAVALRPLDPVNPDISFGITSSLWSEHHEIEWAIKRIAALGLQGIEPYPQQIEKYRSDPLRLKKLFDEAGITLIDVSNGAKGQSTNFIDRDQIPQNDRRSRGVRARLSPGVRRHRLEVQYGEPAARRPQRRSAQAAREYAQRDWSADDRDGYPAGSAPAYLGADGARARGAPGDGAHRSEVRLAHDRYRAPHAGWHGCRTDHERVFSAHR